MLCVRDEYGGEKWHWGHPFSNLLAITCLTAPSTEPLAIGTLPVLESIQRISSPEKSTKSFSPMRCSWRIQIWRSSPSAVELAELGVLVAIGLVALVLVQEELEGHVLSPQLGVDQAPVRKWSTLSGVFRLDEEPVLEA